MKYPVILAYTKHTNESSVHANAGFGIPTTFYRFANKGYCRGASNVAKKVITVVLTIKGNIIDFTISNIVFL